MRLLETLRCLLSTTTFRFEVVHLLPAQATFIRFRFSLLSTMAYMRGFVPASELPSLRVPTQRKAAASTEHYRTLGQPTLHSIHHHLTWVS